MKKAGKDSNEVVGFMVLFQRLRDIISDDPSDLEKRASADEALKRLCNDVGFAAFSLSMNERRHRRLFAAPVDPKFIAAWRSYEEKYASQISGIFLSDLDLGPGGSPVERRSRADVLWENADDEATEQAAALEGAIAFAFEQATDDWRDFGEGFRESIEEGSSAWSRLKKETGFDLRGIFRRRELIPFVLIPRHVSQHHGDREKLSLLTHLQEAHDAFIFGVHFAALALMRSVLEATLKAHYRAPGNDLKERIENCEGLPHRCSKLALQRIRILANDILHFGNDKIRLPDERELLRLLNVLRALIEGVPSSRRG
jgi:hypothetical protein